MIQLDDREIRGRIDKVLGASAEARKNTKLMLLGVMEIEGLHLTDEQKQAYMRCTASETVTRIRRSMKKWNDFGGQPKLELEQAFRTKYRPKVTKAPNNFRQGAYE